MGMRRTFISPELSLHASQTSSAELQRKREIHVEGKKTLGFMPWKRQGYGGGRWLNQPMSILVSMYFEDQLWCGEVGRESHQMAIDGKFPPIPLGPKVGIAYVGQCGQTDAMF
jgi:hypothetical protein